ncbi:MAG: hypothetical protein LBQ88_20075, partial [Treponema sp.]|nr:hypothetical protein [Treponema sp.]
MNKITRIVLTAACILGGLISFLHIMEGYKYVIGEIWAPVHVNIEIDQKFAHNLSLFLPQQKELYWLSPTTDFDADTRTIIMYRQLTTHGFYRGISIRAPEREAAETMAGIDNVSIFIGNKLFYFAASDIQAWKPSTENGYTFFAVPGLHYTPSLAIKNWTNYYGDFNLLLMGFCDFLLRPVRYAPAYFFLACLLYLYRKRLYAAYQALYKKNGTWLVLFVLVVLFGFAMRINGYVRHSGWSDELYAATVAGNPNMPLIQTFTDSGNPPFYFMILRAWFMLFGWSEEAGTALSVLFGTGAIISLYFFI